MWLGFWAITEPDSRSSEFPECQEWTLWRDPHSHYGIQILRVVHAPQLVGVPAQRGSCWHREGIDSDQLHQPGNHLSPTDDKGELPCIIWVLLWTFASTTNSGQSSLVLPSICLWISPEGMGIPLLPEAYF